MNARILTFGCALPLVFSAPGAAQEPDEALAERLVERLWFPEVTFDFQIQLTVSDLEGTTRLTPEERVERLEGLAGVDERLELALALFAAGRRDEGQAQLEDLKTELQAAIREDAEDWKSVAALGEVACNFGLAFKNIEALKAADRLLRKALDEDDELWRAATTLSGLYLWRGITALRNGEEEAAALDFDVAVTSAQRAVIIDGQEIRPHAAYFLTRWIRRMTSVGDDPEALFAEILELVDDLKDAADLAEEPSVPRGLADAAAASMIIGRCLSEDSLLAAYADLDEDVRARRAAIDENLGGIQAHRKFGAQAAKLRWLLAFLAEDEGAGERFDAAEEAADDPADVLALAIGLHAAVERWPEVDELGARLLDEHDGVRTRLVLAGTEGKRGRYEECLAHYEVALEEDEDDMRARVGAAVAGLKLARNTAAAVATLESVLDEEDSGVAAFALGTALALRGELEEAEDALETALELVQEKHKDTVRETLDDVAALSE